MDWIFSQFHIYTRKYLKHSASNRLLGLWESAQNVEPSNHRHLVYRQSSKCRKHPVSLATRRHRSNMLDQANKKDRFQSRKIKKKNLCTQNIRVFDIFTPDTSSPITDSEKNLWKTWISSDVIDWTQMATIISLAWPEKTKKYLKTAAILSAFVFAFRFPEMMLPLSVPTMNLVGIVDSNSRETAPRANSAFS